MGSMKTYAKKIVLAVLIIAAVGLTGFFLWQSFGPQLIGLFQVLSKGDDKAIQEYLSSMGHWEGLLSTFMLSILQVVTIVFPCIVIQIAAGVIYGLAESFAVTYIGFVLGNTLVYYIARKTGIQFTGKIGERINRTWVRRAMAAERPDVVVRLGYMIPGIPNGWVPYIAKDSSLSVKEFMFAAARGSWIQIFLNCLAGTFLVQGQYLFVVLSLLVQGIFVYVVIRRHKAYLKAV
ncbi:MAG: VTT domain-containing protein [Erysipelotrichales bacterium]|nr:VTT domain-containing protein [Erysipelotrichales bacterium]